MKTPKKISDLEKEISNPESEMKILSEDEAKSITGGGGGRLGLSGQKIVDVTKQVTSANVRLGGDL